MGKEPLEEGVSKKTIIKGIIKHEYHPYGKIKIKHGHYKVKTMRTRTGEDHVQDKGIGFKRISVANLELLASRLTKRHLS